MPRAPAARSGRRRRTRRCAGRARTPHPHGDVREAAQAVRERRRARGDHGAVGHERDVGRRARRRCARRNGARFGLPISSSPSTTKRTLSGRPPWRSRSASTALTWANSWPLSSEAPRATIAAVLERRLERVVAPELERIGRLDVVVAVDEHGRRTRHVRRDGRHHRGAARSRAPRPSGPRAAARRRRTSAAARTSPARSGSVEMERIRRKSNSSSSRRSRWASTYAATRSSAAAVSAGGRSGRGHGREPTTPHARPSVRTPRSRTSFSRRRAGARGRGATRGRTRRSTAPRRVGSASSRRSRRPGRPGRQRPRALELELQALLERVDALLHARLQDVELLRRRMISSTPARLTPSSWVRRRISRSCSMLRWEYRRVFPALRDGSIRPLRS
jgi:hypothetical protein